MRRLLALSLLTIAGLAAAAVPALAIERLPRPASSQTLVTPVADLDRKATRGKRAARHVRARHAHYASRWHRYRRWDPAYPSVYWSYDHAGYPAWRYRRDIIYTHFPGHFHHHHYRHRHGHRHHGHHHHAHHHHAHHHHGHHHHGHHHHGCCCGHYHWY
jgi:hypothetical protein